MKSKTLRISSILPISEANGPGPHYTIWFQGCGLKCSGCFNPHTHDPRQGHIISISNLIEEIKAKWESKSIRGVTLTGGEPLDQIKEVLELVVAIKKIGEACIIILSGYEEDKLRFLAEYPTLRMNTDVIIAGRFIQNKKLQSGIRGSNNKKILLYSKLYSVEEFESIPLAEVLMNNDGTITLTGIEPEIIRNNSDNIY